MHVCVQLCCGYGKREKGNKYVVQMRRVEQILNKFFPEGFCEYSLFCKCSSAAEIEIVKIHSRGKGANIHSA